MCISQGVEWLGSREAHLRMGAGYNGSSVVSLKKSCVIVEMDRNDTLSNVAKAFLLLPLLLFYTFLN